MVRQARITRGDMAYVAIYQLLISLFVGCNYWWPFAPLDKRYSSDVYLMQFG